MKRLIAALGVAVAAAAFVTAAPANAADAGRTLFVQSAVEHADGTVTLPLYRGVSHGHPVWYVVLDASTSNAASKYGVNRSNKLANAKGTAAVQKVTSTGGVLNFPASVDFSPTRVVVPGPTGFPPAAASPGAVGEDGYSPLIQLPDGTVLDAPQLANASGQADKVVSIDTTASTVTYRETNGFARNRPVRYVSTEASDAGRRGHRGRHVCAEFERRAIRRRRWDQFRTDQPGRIRQWSDRGGQSEPSGPEFRIVGRT